MQHDTSDASFQARQKDKTEVSRPSTWSHTTNTITSDIHIDGQNRPKVQGLLGVNTP
jgi:hypothetical protein